MELSILSDREAASVADLVRLYHKTERDWTSQTSEYTAFDFGEAFHSSELSRVRQANALLDAFVPDEFIVTEIVQRAREHFSKAGGKCRRWTINPSSADTRTKPLIEALISDGFVPRKADLMLLRHATAHTATSSHDGLKILPARAAYQHARRLAELAAGELWNDLQFADAAMMHVDDPRFEAWIAIVDGVPAARAGVLTVGEIGRVDEVYTAPQFRRRGLATAVLRRVLDSCARSLFKHVMLTIASTNAPAISLYDRLGFRRIAEIIDYVDTSD